MVYLNQLLQIFLGEIQSPSIATLETICSGFGITMSQFFAEGDMVEITPELKELFDNWVNLTPEQKKAANQMLKAMSNSK